MNKLKTTFNGGMPNFLDNFRWHEEGVNEVLAHIVKGMANGGDVLRLYGANVSSSGVNYLITAGAVFFQGEVFTVPAHTIQKLPTGDPGTYYWEFEETYDSEGLLTYELEGMPPQNCYAIRVAKLKKTSEILDPGSYVSMGIPDFRDIFTLRSTFETLQSSHISLSNEFSKLSDQIGSAYFRAAFQYENSVYINMPWISAFGSIKSDEADLKIVNGGVYEVNITELPNGATLRLYHDSGPVAGGLDLDYELSPGLNIFHLNGYAGEYDISLQGNNIDGTVQVVVRLIAVDPNPSTENDGDVVVNPG